MQCDVCGPASLSGLLQLGDGTTTSPRLTPTPVSGLSLGVLVVSLGSRHSCAIDAARVLYCWGDNTNGQVRQDVCMSPFARALPSCFLDALISTFLSSQIGIGTTTSQATPVCVSISGLNFTAVSAGKVSRLCLW